MRALRYVLWVFGRLFLSLRYRVRVHGQEQLRGLDRGTLILPNHPGLIDPVLLLTTFWPSLHPRPLMAEGEAPSLGFRLLMKLINAIPVPDLNRPSKEARARAEQALGRVAEALRRGDNVLLWPAGKITRNGAESLGSARAAADTLQQVPEANVVLVRTRGVWGSSFSRAFLGKTPGLGGRLLAGIGWLFANLFVLMPRRRVDVTVRRLRREELPELTREKLNPWLEQWYNADLPSGPEKPKYVPYHFLFGPRTFEYPKIRGLEDLDLGKVKPETKDGVAKILADKLRRSAGEELREPQTTLDQLGMDSLDRMEVTLNVERRFGFHGDQVPGTVGELWALAEGIVEKAPPKPAPPEWFRPPAPPTPAPPPTGGGGVGEGGAPDIMGETVAEAFVARALACPRDVAVADDMAGVLTYDRLLIGAIIMARRFAKLPGDNVGLMMPASVAADVALMGLSLAGKLPVVLNWTTGSANLEHAARLMKLEHVVTSQAFIDRTGIEIKGTRFFFLEDVRKGVGRWEKLRTLLSVKLFSGSVRGRVPKAKPDDTAVVLFTSGSERAPKAVPLTHRNLLTNQRAGISVFGLTRHDCALGFLPTFHSFGLSITTLLPVLAGIKVVHHPDPTDSGRLARKIGAYKVTVLVGTPTFVAHIVERSEPGELATLRLIVVGAEKCPEALVQRCAQAAPGAKVLEGYGITECSPVVSVNRPDNNRVGSLGQPLPGVELQVVDLQTDEPLPAGQRGMLLVSGPTVFPGYIGFDGPSPFRERDGKRWYVTGDLVTVDQDGFIYFNGRLKRFLKSGGEMISLPAVEEPLAKRYPATDKGPRVAVEGAELPGGKARLVLFTTEEVDVDEANRLLRQEGMDGLWQLNEVRRVKAIPVLGTGKTDYKVLRQWVTEGQREPEAVAR
jgi:acyl-CoA synthetase (AMP-forming)/AMP-acid ligase II/1-acyl-sn-glycerol-3-phosphate acyltransferase/acyl carrier protein